MYKHLWLDWACRKFRLITKFNFITRQIWPNRIVSHSGRWECRYLARCNRVQAKWKKNSLVVLRHILRDSVVDRHDQTPNKQTIKHQCLSVHVNDWPFWINDYVKVQLYVSMQIVSLYVSNTQLIVILCNWFSLGVNDQPLREIESIFVMFDCPKVLSFIGWCYWMLTHANSVKFVRVNEVHGSVNKCIFAL